MSAAVVIRMPRPFSVNNMFASAGRRRVPTKKYAAWRQEAMWMARTSYRGGPISEPVHIEIVIGADGVSPNFDTDNAAKAYLDALVSAGVLANDTRRIVRRLALSWDDEADFTAIWIAGEHDAMKSAGMM